MERVDPNKKIRCVNKEGKAKMLTSFTVKNGGAKRQGFWPDEPAKINNRIAKASTFDVVVSDGNHGPDEEITPEIADETKPAKGKPGRKPNKN